MTRHGDLSEAGLAIATLALVVIWLMAIGGMV